MAHGFECLKENIKLTFIIAVFQEHVNISSTQSQKNMILVYIKTL